MTSWNTVLCSQGGAASLAQLAAAGATPRALTQAVREGRLLRPRRGMYALPSIPGPMLEALRLRGRLSCVSAARTYGLWAGSDDRTHVHLPAQSTRIPSPGARTVLHWRHSDPHREPGRVSVSDCLRSVARCADEETAVAVLDTAIGAGLVSLGALRRIFEGETRRACDLAAKARPGSDSGVESIVRQRLSSAGHLVEQQVAIPGIGRVDLRVNGTLLIEIDGFAFHSNREAFERDRARDTALVLSGARRLRFSANQVLREWGYVAEAVDAALAIPEDRYDAPPERAQLRRIGS
ncbi:type IV toxin-antitoxin system AbiEi family antitoxin domain-containing protein [Leifsonia sp. NPDC058248]|uniref:type IV toxin-antitoxin system AbiEi family antitoxin domain-containing protein n=1 Tax=Leifsonia sp. NPDC058248 TaxID=3346402 RepID=UPI0036DF0DFA